MNISVIGTGYVGLITGTCLAELGMNVVCVDKDEEKINSLKNFQIPIYEPGLETIVKRNFLKNRLTFTTKIKEAVIKSDAIFISVGTPSSRDGKVDLKYIHQAAKEIADCMDSYKLIIIKSTVPIGTCRHVKRIIEHVLKEQNKMVEFDIVSNPEFLREGSALYDFSCPDRIVIGVESEKAKSLMRSIYNADIFKNTPFIETTIETSEMIKYASNAFLATKISYINEIANICELCGADIKIVAEAMGLDQRIGDKFLNPGPGFGGSCFPKDIKAIIMIGKDLGYTPNIIKSVMKSNLLQKKHSVKMIKDVVGNFRNKTFTVLGLAFKPETDDIRESPSIFIVKELLKHGGKVKVFDPKAMDNMKKLNPKLKVTYCDCENSACEGSDCIILATEWNQFKSLDFAKLISTVNTPIIIDLKNLFDPNEIRDLGFLYKGVGRQ